MHIAIDYITWQITCNYSILQKILSLKVSLVSFQVFSNFSFRHLQPILKIARSFSLSLSFCIRIQTSLNISNLIDLYLYLFLFSLLVTVSVCCISLFVSYLFFLHIVICPRQHLAPIFSPFYLPTSDRCPVWCGN